MTFLWATRGREWGFRFLRDGGAPDPLRLYEEVFDHAGDDRKLWVRIGEAVALRFPDPLGREDAAGRVIPHEFVVMQPLSAQVRSVEDGLGLIWPEVAEEYARVWDQPEPTTESNVPLA